MLSRHDRLSPVLMGASPFGSLLCGAGRVAGAAWFKFQPPKMRSVVRPTNQQLGISPPPAEGEN